MAIVILQVTEYRYSVSLLRYDLLCDRMQFVPHSLLLQAHSFTYDLSLDIILC